MRIVSFNLILFVFLRLAFFFFFEILELHFYYGHNKCTLYGLFGIHFLFNLF